MSDDAATGGAHLSSTASAPGAPSPAGTSPLTANAAITAAPVWESDTSGTEYETGDSVGLQNSVTVNVDQERGAWGQEAHGVVLSEVNGRDKQEGDGGGLRGGDGRHARDAQMDEEKGVVVSGGGVGCESGDVLNPNLVHVERPVVSSPITCSDAAGVTVDKPRAPARSIVLIESGEYRLEGKFQGTNFVFEVDSILYHGCYDGRNADTPDEDDADELNSFLLNLIPSSSQIPCEMYPRYDADVFGSEQRLISDVSVHVKRPSFFYFSTSADFSADELMRAEVRSLRQLANFPHRNIVKYKGCIVRDGRVFALCLEKYHYTLEKAMEDEQLRLRLDVSLIMASLRSAVAHLHSLNICHNDIVPRNVMFDSNNEPILIDFDSSMPPGSRLLKAGSPCRSDGVVSNISSKLHDTVALTRIEKFLNDEGDQ